MNGNDRENLREPLLITAKVFIQIYKYMHLLQMDHFRSWALFTTFMYSIVCYTMYCSLIRAGDSVKWSVK